MHSKKQNIELLSSKITESLDVRAKARINAQKDLPNKLDNDLDTVQSDIIHTFNEEIEAHKNFTEDRLNAERDIRFKIFEEFQVAADLNQIKDDIKNNFKTFKSTYIKKLKVNYYDVMTKAERDLKAFKDEHQLQNKAEYPKSNIKKYAIIALVLVFEVIFNSSMFAEASEWGLIGGAATAAIISVVNVLFGTMAGFYLIRGMNYIQMKKKVFYITGFITYLILIPICFNLLVAHYRALLVTGEDFAITQAPLNFLNSPFGIANFDSWVLFVIGIIVAIVSCREGYHLDDPYPHYGKHTRNYLEAKDEYQSKKNEGHTKLDTYYSEARTKLNTNISKLHSKVSEFTTSLERAKSILSQYHKIDLINANEQVRRCIKLYREVNSDIRTEPAPEYYSTDINVNYVETLKIHDASIENAEEQSIGLKQKADKIELNRETHLMELSELRDELKTQLVAIYQGMESNKEINNII